MDLEISGPDHVAQEALDGMEAALAPHDGDGDGFLGASLGLLQNDAPGSDGMGMTPSEAPSSMPSDSGDQERRKRRRQQWEKDQADKRRWDLQRRVVDISTDMDLLVREVSRVRNELHVPLPPLSSLPAYEIQTLDAARSRRLTEILNSQCKKTLQGITAHKWSWPFNTPVDINIYHDYLETVDTPMDFGTVKRRLESGHYTHPEAFHADVNLVFDNARAYNKPGSDVHVMATTLKEKFQDKYVAAVAPRVTEEAAITAAAALAARRRHAGAAAQAAAGPQREAAEARCAFLVRYIDQVSACIADAKSAAAAACVPLTRAEKETLCADLGKLPQHHFEAAIGLVMHHHPGLQPYDEVGFDLDLLDALTLRQVQSFVAAAQVAEEERKVNRATGGKDETAQVNWPGLPLGAGVRPFVPPRRKTRRPVGDGGAAPAAEGGGALGSGIGGGIGGGGGAVVDTPAAQMVAVPPAQSAAPVPTVGGGVSVEKRPGSAAGVGSAGGGGGGGVSEEKPNGGVTKEASDGSGP